MIKLQSFILVLFISGVALGGNENNKTDSDYYSFKYLGLKCATGSCNNVVLTKLNNPSQVSYATQLQFETSTKQVELDPSTPTSEYVVYGRLHKQSGQDKLHTFVVSNLYRNVPLPTASYGTPPPAASTEGTFYRVQGAGFGVCKSLNCSSLALNEINSKNRILIKSISSPYTGLLIDKTWIDYVLFSLKLPDTGMVRATVNNGSATITALYVNLPDPDHSCAEFKLAACPEGTTRTYTRNPDRCFTPGECVTRSPCPLNLPQCPAGYTRVDYPALPHACQKHICDPSFVKSTKSAFP